MAAAKLDEQALFLAARGLAGADARRDYVREACGDDHALRRRVEALLRVDGEDGEFLRSPAEGVGRDWAAPAAEGVGDRVGPFTLTRQLGEGGMGVVFRAEQEQPVRRAVALKILRPGMDTRPLLARLQAERQALALMDHPNIAKFLDAGSTASGRPYIAMELVDGAPVTRYCDEHRLGVRERLGLFVAVCRGVQHAHQKGVVHRDLKPSNVLVASYDGVPVPKIIDFGLAKATGRPLTDSTVVTHFGLVVGTPAYMAPEQADAAQADVDTRADVYSLGALLYELLTGTPPLRWGVGAGGLAEFLRAVREDEPPRPSVRLAEAGGPPGVAAARGVEPKSLVRLVRGDLDWIATKCLEKDRARRYATVEGLAQDVERHLRDEPVEASPPGAGYRARKFARRRRAALVTAAAFAALLVLGAAGSAWQAVRATAERDAKELALQAEAAQRRQAVAERDRADEEAEVARAVEDFLCNDLLGQAAVGNQAGGPRDKTVSVRTLLDRAAGRIGPKFAGQPRTEAAVRTSVGGAYRALGLYPEAAAQFERALPLRRAKLGPDHADTAQAANNLAAVYLDLGRYDDAEPLFREAVAAWEARLGADHFTTLKGVNNLAMLYQSRGRWGEAEPLLGRVLAWHRENSGPDHPGTLLAESNLGGQYLDRGRHGAAAEMFAHVLRVRRAEPGPDHPDTLASMNHLGLALSGLKRPAEAEPLFREALAGRRAQLEPDHPDTLRTMVNLGALCRDAGRFAEAEALTRDAAAAAHRKLAPGHPRLRWFAEALAEVYDRQGKHALAEPPLRELAELARAASGPGSPAYAGQLARLALNLLDQGKFADADAPARDCLTIRAAREPDGWATFSARSVLGAALLGQQKYDAAEPLLKDGYEGLKQRRDAIPEAARKRHDEARERLARLHDERGRPGEAARVRGEAAE